MDEHKKFLADRLLSEERPITYRLLSRALDVHVNTAKCMLSDFYKYQNGLRADSVHATYLIYGTKSTKSGHGIGDVEMSSASEPEPHSEMALKKSLTLVEEQSLQALLAEYQEVTSVHIYSLAPHSQRDVAALAELSTSISEYPREDDPVVAAKKYGTILNANVRKRDRVGRPAVQAGAAPKQGKSELTMLKSAHGAKIKQEAAETPSKDVTPPSSFRKNVTPTTKRGGPGDIMQSFAKAISKTSPKSKQTTTKEGAGTVALSDDGEADDFDMPPFKTADKDGDAARKGRKEREEELRRMMEEDDKEEESDRQGTNPDDEEEMEEAPEPEPEAETGTDNNLKAHKEPAEVVSSTGDGRRRGKRRVMQKKCILDDQGYMVTIQEPGWESFSEDEISQPPAKKATPASTPSASGLKMKRGAGKVGQGNIMSFFSKK